MSIEITTLSYGYEITWKLVESGGTTSTCSGGHYASYSTTAHNGCKLKKNTNYVLFCEDEWGDGWNGGYIKIAGAQYCQNFNQQNPNTCSTNYQCNTEMCVSYIKIKGTVQYFYRNTKYL